MRALLTLLLVLGPAITEAQDADAGRRVFRKCSSCHALEAGPPMRAGPPLSGIVGRTIGSLPDFSYNGSLRSAGWAGEAWTEDRLSRFIENPRAVFPDTKMEFVGIKQEQQRLDLIAYLKAQSAP